MAGIGLLSFDGIGLLILLVCAVASFFVVWAALSLPRLWDFYLLVLLLLAAMAGAVAATNLLLFYVAWEVTAFIGWGIGRWASAGHRQSMMGALPLQGFGSLGSLGVAVALLAMALPSRSLATHGLQTTDIKLLSALLLGGIILKSFALLTAAWYPSRDEQSFYLAHAVLGSGGMLAVGLFPYLRFLGENMAQRPEWREPALVVGLVIALLLALAALGEQDLHKVLAYATFSQFGGLLAFFAVVPPADLTLAAVALLPYCLAIAGLALSLGAVGAATGQRDLRLLGGLLHRMPLGAGLFLLSGFALAGLPPLGGYASRLSGSLALLNREQSVASYLFLAIGAATLLYLLRLFRAIFLGEDKPLPRPVQPAPPSLMAMASLIVLALLFVGFQPGTALALLRPAIETALK